MNGWHHKGRRACDGLVGGDDQMSHPVPNNGGTKVPFLFALLSLDREADDDGVDEMPITQTK